MAAWKPCPACEIVLVRLPPEILETRTVLCAACLQAYQHSPEEDIAHEVLIQWFHAHYASPVDVCPFESAEGGYQWIWGGPYDAYDELQRAWEHIFTEGFLAQAALQITCEAGTEQWSGLPETQGE